MFLAHVLPGDGGYPIIWAALQSLVAKLAGAYGRRVYGRGAVAQAKESIGIWTHMSCTDSASPIFCMERSGQLVHILS
jgi:hypothetical protein